jgi:hypothetical protein
MSERSIEQQSQASTDIAKAKPRSWLAEAGLFAAGLFALTSNGSGG